MPDEHEFTAALTGGPGGDAPAIIEVAQQAVEPVVLDTDAVYAIRNADGGAMPIDLERFRSAPDRVRTKAAPATVESFIDYVQRFAEDRTTVWVHPTDGVIAAVLDDDAPGKPSWCEHSAKLALIPTPEWLFWKSQDGNLLGQEEFAEHVEDGLSQLVDPDGAKMLEIAQSVQAKNNVAFRSGYDLTNGEVRFAYEEQIEAKAGQKGDLVLPQTFTLGIAPFVGEDAYKIEARLRMRINGGKLRLGYKLTEPDLAVRDVLTGIAERIAAAFPNTYLGTAPTR